VGLKSKSYCILNKEYGEKEYKEMLPKIIRHMKDMPYTDTNGQTYSFGDFFPPSFSHFAYNETAAQEYFPLTKEDALTQHRRWRDPEQKEYKIDIASDEIPERIADVSDDIVGKVIGCAHKGQCEESCTTAFKIIPSELQFYRNLNLPLPRFCPSCRHYQRFRKRNPLKLWMRICQCGGKESGNGTYTNVAEHAHGADPCPNEFQTSYAPERAEIVYCETCYQQEAA
jgi:hypothetical protein